MIGPNVFPHVGYVLHSPYADGTWRGWEKCMGTMDAQLVFPTREEAEKALTTRTVTPEFYRVVEVTILTPGVRKPLDAADYAHTTEAPFVEEMEKVIGDMVADLWSVALDPEQQAHFDKLVRLHLQIIRALEMP